MRYQSGILSVVHLEHEIGWEAINIAPDLLVQAASQRLLAVAFFSLLCGFVPPPPPSVMQSVCLRDVVVDDVLRTQLTRYLTDQGVRVGRARNYSENPWEMIVLGYAENPAFPGKCSDLNSPVFSCFSLGTRLYKNESSPTVAIVVYEFHRKAQPSEPALQFFAKHAAGISKLFGSEAKIVECPPSSELK